MIYDSIQVHIIILYNLCFSLYFFLLMNYEEFKDLESIE